MAFKQIKFRLIGTRPLLVQSDKLADPLNPLTSAHKAITSKKTKTEDDYIAIARSEWSASLYFDKDIGPYLPGINIEGSLIAGAKLSKLGTHIKRGVEILDDRCPIVYDGPRDTEGLWDKGFRDARSVVVSGKRIVRYRPIFRHWSVECTVLFDQEILNQEQILKALQDAGAYCGVGTYRPKFGRFDVEVLA